MFTRTAFEVKNGSRRTVVPTREIAVALRDNDPQFKYGRISAVKVSFWKPGFGQVETFAKRTTRKQSIAVEPWPTGRPTNPPCDGCAPRKRGRPTNAERAARATSGSQPSVAARGIAPAVQTAPPTDVPSSVAATTNVA